MSGYPTRVAEFETVAWTVGTSARVRRWTVHLIAPDAVRTFCGQALPSETTRDVHPVTNLTCKRCQRRAKALAALADFAAMELVGENASSRDTRS